jgi:hypothetical protein
MRGLLLGLLLCFIAVLGYGCMPTYRCLSTNYKSSSDINESATATVGSIMVKWTTWDDCVGEQGGRVFATYKDNEFSQELIYSGLQGNTIFLLYREYQGRLIRGAFTQQLTLYNRRLGTAEPVFGNICSTIGLNRFTLRGKGKVNTQWLLYCAVHNLFKVHRYGLEFA